jgi:hypothetical protein
VNKNRLLALLILILIIGGIVFWIVWGVVLNKGTIVFSYTRPPYTVQIEQEQKTCLERECEFWLPVGPRAYTITKDGYYEKSGSVNVVRDKKITENILLEFIPQAAEGTVYKTYQLPAGYSKFLESLKEISLFAELPENLELKGLPKIINNLIFSMSGQKALVFEQNKFSLYSTDNASSKEIDALESVSAVFSKDESELYTVSYDKSAKKYALKKISLNTETPSESLVYFGRDVKNYEIKISDSGGLVALADKTFSPEILYLIDLNAKSRTNIFEGYLIETGSWSASGEIFIFKAKALNENFSSVYYYRADDKTLQKLDADIELSNFSFIDGQAAFVSSQGYRITNYSVPYSIQFEEMIAPSTIEGITAEDSGGKSMILAKWDLTDGQFYLVKDLSGIISTVPEKIELSPDGKTVRMLIEGQIYDIRISE